MIQPVPKPEVVRDPRFRMRIKWLPCIIDSVPPPSDPAHIKNKHGYGDKENMVPLCHPHHLEWHRGQKTFQAKYRIRVQPIANRLWAEYVKRELRSNPA